MSYEIVPAIVTGDRDVLVQDTSGSNSEKKGMLLLFSSINEVGRAPRVTCESRVGYCQGTGVEHNERLLSALCGFFQVWGVLKTEG